MAKSPSFPEPLSTTIPPPPVINHHITVPLPPPTTSAQSSSPTQLTHPPLALRIHIWAALPGFPIVSVRRFCVHVLYAGYVAYTGPTGPDHAPTRVDSADVSGSLCGDERSPLVRHLMGWLQAELGRPVLSLAGLRQRVEVEIARVVQSGAAVV